MALDKSKYSYGDDVALRDTRPISVKLKSFLSKSNQAAVFVATIAVSTLFFPMGVVFSDIILILLALFFWWHIKQPIDLVHKMPAHSPYPDPANIGGGRSGQSEGIMFLGNMNEENKNAEVWFTNDDIRTHMLYLGTTGSGKSEGLKSICSNALCWGSGFIYIDGKADTDLWSSISSLARRFGRDDDLMVLNFMTGNSDDAAVSNSMNPFATGSASYLTNLLVSLMPEAEGDNAMWTQRAQALLATILPAFTHMRDKLDQPMSIGTLRKSLTFPEVIKLSRNQALPQYLRDPIVEYLNELPGYDDRAFTDDGKDKPAGPDVPQIDTQVPKQQHGYLTMQFTRALQSLGDDYGYIFDVPNADVDMVDVVLNRRILIVLIPALEKSGEEIANLGKIVAATLKGMMGSTLGSTVEGTTDTVIENKPTKSSTPFVTVFDEVGYYVTDGMAVMAAQARSLGFSLVYAAQDLSALEKRVKEEAKSITANCNIKIFGKLSEPTVTKEFFKETIGQAIVTKVSGYEIKPGSLFGGYEGQLQASQDFWDKIDYSDTTRFKEGEAALSFSGQADVIKFYYCNPGHAKAMRVQKMIGFDKTDDYLLKNLENLSALRDRLVHKTWTAAKADVSMDADPRLETVIAGLQSATDNDLTPIEQGAMALAHLYATENPDALKAKDKKAKEDDKSADTKTEDSDNTDSSKADGDTGDGDMSWMDVLNGDDSAGVKTADKPTAADKVEDQDEEEDTSSSGSGKAPTTQEYTAEDAVEKKAETGLTIFPDDLSEEVKAILKNAADTLTAGLFTAPSRESYYQGGGGEGKSVKMNVKNPMQQPGQGKKM